MAKNFLRNHLKAEFAQIPNALIEDRTLSATARALFCYLAVKPDNWEFFMPDIADGLRISQDTLRKVIKELILAGWIEDGGQDRKSGQFGSKIISIFAFKTPKTGDERIGNLPIRQKTESVKNRIGKNPTHNNKQLKKYSSLKNTHSSSSTPQLIEEEEEGVIPAELVAVDPYSAIPNEGIDGLSRDVIIAGINRLVVANAGDDAPYRATLIREIMSGGGRTLRNIRNHPAPVPRPDRPRIGSNRGEPSLPPGVSIFDLIEQWSGDEGGAV